MAKPLECSFKKEFLEICTILYVEEDQVTRDDAFEIFSGFFKEVIVASNRQDGLEEFKKYRDNIDIILCSVNSPEDNSIDFIVQIRNLDWNIPLLMTTAIKEPDILIQAIKLNVTNYILKPIQLNTTFKIIATLMEEKESQKKLIRQANELEQFMTLLETQNLICEIGLDGTILHVNDLYLLASGYDVNDLINKNINNLIISDSKFMEMQKVIKSSQTWCGDCKKKAKDGSIYYTHSILLPIYENNGRLKKFIEIATLTTKYEKEILSLKKHVMAIRSEHTKTSMECKSKVSISKELANKLQNQLEDSVNNSQQVLMELYDMKKQNKYLEEKLNEQEKRLEEFQSYHYAEIDRLRS